MDADNGAGFTGEPERAEINQNQFQEENKQYGFEENKDTNFVQDEPRETIDNNQNDEEKRIASLTEQAQRLMNQRDKLKTHFKELNVKLASTLQKVKQRNKPAKKEEKKEENPQLKELDKINKQCQLYRREIQTLKIKIDSAQSQYRVQQLENQAREREREIQKLVSIQNNAEKIRRDQERELNVFQNEYNYLGKIKAYTDEIKELRGKQRKITEELKDYDKKFKAQQEWLVVLEERHFKVCAELGISASLNFSTQEKSNKLQTALSPKYRIKKKKQEYDLLKDGTYFGYKYDKDDEQDAKLEFSKENFEKIKQDCKDLRTKMYGGEKDTKGQMKKENVQLTAAKKEYDRIKAEYDNKEKEVNSLTHKMNEFKRLAKHNQMLVSQGKASLPDGLTYPTH